MTRPLSLPLLAAALSLALATGPRAAAAAAADACAPCHADPAKVLPKGHPEVKEKGVAACVACHDTGRTGNAVKNPFSARLHLSHAGTRKLDCTACHAHVPGKSFGLLGLEASWGAPKDEDLVLMKKAFASWAGGKLTDSAHARAGVDCAGCHGKTAPVSDDTVESERCLACHGPVDKLAARSLKPEWPKRNPHDSHLGRDVACTTCHHAHAASVVYCADCHRLWKLEIPGSGK